MKKRILSLILSTLMIVTILPISAFAEDAGPMSISEAGLALVKRFEGFTATAMADGSQWSIGYGNACDPADYPNGITEDEAEALLLDAMAYFEDSINRYLDRYGVTVTQAQFDALASITYNLGAAWINSSYRFWTMLREGLDHYTDNQIASAIGVWCHVGTAVNVSVLQRRIAEIRLFLYGDYTGAESPNFKYLLFNGNGGSVDTDVMLYRENEPYLEFPGVSREGYHFTGWYTAREGGSPVSAADPAKSNQTLYARWSQTPAAVPQPAGTFSDVSAGDWYAPYVADLTESGIISGYSDGTFRPKAAVTAGQALKLILLAAGCGEQAPTSSHWASGYRSLALSRRILDDGEIGGLDEPVSRAVVAKLAANALGLEIDGSASVFHDTDDAYAAALYRAGILEGSVDGAGNRLFYPDKHITRAEIAKIVWTMEQR